MFKDVALYPSNTISYWAHFLKSKPAQYFVQRKRVSKKTTHTDDKIFFPKDIQHKYLIMIQGEKESYK